MKLKSILLTAVTTIGLATALMGQVPSYVPTNGLVGWWPFNGNANDASGNGNNGTVNGATLVSDRWGLNNSAFYFNGINNFIQISDQPSFNFVNYSLSFWCINDPMSNLSVKYLLNKGCYPNLSFRFYFDGIPISDISTQNNLQFVSGPPPSANWINYITTYDGFQIKLYVNGVLVDSDFFQGILNDTSEPLIIGGRQDGQNCQVQSHFFGAIDDIGIWNRALTQQEISDLYNGCQLSVNNQPINQTVNTNNNAQFVLSSSDPGATYQWQTDLGVGFQNLNSVGQYSGTTTNTLTVSNVTMSNNNQPFRCIISSSSCSDTSNVAVLTVNNNVGINETIQENLFSVFPNPAQNVINIKIDSQLIGSVYSIYDSTGRIVLTGKLNSDNTTIELDKLSGGSYLFSVGENMKQALKIFKAE